MLLDAYANGTEQNGFPAVSVASGVFAKSCAHTVRGKPLWERCCVSPELEVHFYTSASISVLEKSGIKGSSKTPSYFVLACENRKELSQTELSLPLSPKVVYSYACSAHSGESNPPSVTSVLPTIVLLLQAGVCGSTFTLVLRPFEATRKSGKSLGYRGYLNETVASARIAVVSPCGNCVVLLKEQFEQVGDDSCCASGTYLETSDILDVDANSLNAPRRVKLTVHFPPTVSKKAFRRFLDSSIQQAYFVVADENRTRDPQLRLSSLELRVLTTKWAFTFGLYEKENFTKRNGIQSCCDRPLRLKKCGAEKGNTISLFNFSDRWNVSRFYLDRCEPKKESEGHSAASGWTALAKNSIGNILLLCGSADTGVVVTLPRTSDSTHFQSTEILFPFSGEIHDATFVEDSVCSGFLLAVRSRPAASLNPSRSKTAGDATGLQLWFSPIGASSFYRLSFLSLRRWGNTASFFSVNSSFSFRACGAKDDSGTHGQHEIKLCSSTSTVTLNCVFNLPQSPVQLNAPVSLEIHTLVEQCTFLFYAQRFPLFWVENDGEAKSLQQVEGCTEESERCIRMEGLCRRFGEMEIGEDAVFLQSVYEYLTSTALSEEVYSPVAAESPFPSFFAGFWNAMSSVGLASCRLSVSRVKLLFNATKTMKDMIVFMQLHCSDSVLSESLSHVQKFINESGIARGSVWHMFVQALIDTASTSLVRNEYVQSLTPHFSRRMMLLLRNARSLLEEEEKKNSVCMGDVRVPLLTLNAHENKSKPIEEVRRFVANGFRGDNPISVLDVYWASRRLFLEESPQAAVELLQQFSRSGSCSDTLVQLQSFYESIIDKLRLIHA